MTDDTPVTCYNSFTCVSDANNVETEWTVKYMNATCIPPIPYSSNIEKSSSAKYRIGVSPCDSSQCSMHVFKFQHETHNEGTTTCHYNDNVKLYNYGGTAVCPKSATICMENDWRNLIHE